ncbi:lanC-like protein GCL1 [Andrographis paniculata]|uniref:lanC-like protein GCL1 n=1 Tax=Andrographis paniculata TaxID=175694 RepID=UPI0021E9293F|nr:lanC-like protein GCL1 [Andrographis paniculata]
MSSSVIEYASQRSSSSKNNSESGDDPIDLFGGGCDLIASDLWLTADAFMKAAVSLKDQVVEMTWGRRESNVSLDSTVYTGLMGTAFTCLRSYQATGNLSDLRLCNEIVDACSTAARTSTRHTTFLCGRGGVYAIGAIAANYSGDLKKRDVFLDCFMEMAQERALPSGPEEGGFGMSYDLLYGRAGFLWAALFINKHLQVQAIPNDLLMPIVEAVLAGGRAGAPDNTACPHMYRWHGTRYWGAAHGLAGVIHVLLHFPLCETDTDDVKATLRYMMRNRFAHTGNYPVSEGNPRDTLVQWSHGATGIALTLCKAAEVLVPNEREFRSAAIEAGEVVWRRGMGKKMGLADGIAGNAFAFLSLLRLTGEAVYEERAKTFSSYLYDTVRKSGAGNGTNHSFSLFEGLAGASCLWFDLVRPQESRFPGYEI